jgi:hypothetical protein
VLALFLENEITSFCRIFIVIKTTGGIALSWIKAKGVRGEWNKAKEGENFHGYSNNENQKPLETLLKIPKEDKGKFFTPAPKK